MLETLASWSKARLWWTLGLGYVVAVELTTLLASRIPPCVIETQVQTNSDGTNDEYCPASHAVLGVLGGFLDEHEGAFTALGTLAIAVFTWTLWRSTDKLWRAGEQQFALARNAFLSTHRPQIRFKHVWLMSDFAYDKPITVRVLCVNNGATDGTIIQYAINILVIKNGRFLPIPDFEGKKINAAFTLKSGITLQFQDVSFDITEDQEVGIRRHEAKFYCVGYLHYADGDGRIRTSAFCRVLAAPDGGAVISGRRFTKVKDPDYEYED